MARWRGPIQAFAAWLLLVGIVAQAVGVPGAVYILFIGSAVFTITFLVARDYIFASVAGLLFLPHVLSRLPFNSLLPTIRLSILLLLSGTVFAVVTALIFRYRMKTATSIKKSEELFD